MPDEPDPREPGYDWLFTGDQRPRPPAGASPSESEPPADPDSTQAWSPGWESDDDSSRASGEDSGEAPTPAGSSDARSDAASGQTPASGQTTASGQTPASEPDHTRILEVQPRAGGPIPGTAAAGAAAAAAAASGAAAASSGAASAGAGSGGAVTPPPAGGPLGSGTPPQSFGGTFPAPPSTAPRTTRTPTSQPSQGTGSYQPGPPRTPQGATPTPPPPRKKRRNWWLRGILIVFVLWLLFLVVVPIWAWQKISKVDAEPDGQRPPDTAGTTYLLVGSDSRAGLTKQQRGQLGTGDAAGGRTDTIIMLHVPDNSGPTLLLSIPRDSYVDIPGHGMNKINAAYAFGGPELLVETLEKATGVRIDDYVEVGFSGFVDAVDAVGGITVCPTEKIDDPKAGNLKMSAGCHDIDGQTALDYSRSRAFALGDITRALHQREVITAVGSKAASWKTVVLPWRYFRVNKAAADTLQVGQNVGPIDLARFAWAMAHTAGSNAKRCVVPYSSLGESTDVGSVVVWDEQKAKAVFQGISDDDTASIDCTPTGQ